MNDRSGFDLNTVQLLSSMGAAVTGAILTSYLGNGGTILGTAVGAGASTAGFAVYKHYLSRTKEKVAPVIAQRARQWTPTTQASSHRATAAEQTEARTVASPDRAVPGDDRTHDFRRPGTGPAGNGPAATRQDNAWQSAATETAPAFGTAHMGAGGVSDPDGRNGNTGPTENGGPAGNGGDDEPGKHGGGFGQGLRGHPRWLIMAASSAAVFLVVMLVITLVEFGTGKPIDASVWGRKASGTTLGNVTGSNPRSGTVTPTVSPSVTQSATPGGVGETTPQPSSSATTAPSPSSVPSVSTAPAQSAPARSAPARSAPAQNGAPQDGGAQTAPAP